MATNVKSIVSMLVSEQKITLYTATGEVLDMKVDGPYDTGQITEFLSPKITGMDPVEIDLAEYLNLNRALKGPDGEGMLITTFIDGKEVQGIFYPQKVEVSVEHEGEQVVVPNLENLSKHIRRAADTKSPAVRNFLRRIAPVIKERKHSAEDLMAFIERSELPLTNDGRIIGYKKVNKTAGNKFVDCHSGKVAQQLGSRVWMDADKVDPSRANSCSNGLHVANLGYLRGFGGTHTLIVLVDPADFIAVPHGETNKARVCAYDIIGVMSSGSHKVVESGAHVEGDHTLESIIKGAVDGTHVKPFEKIQVGDKCVLKVERIGAEENTTTYEAAHEETTSSGKSLNTDTPEEKKNILKTAKTASGKTPWNHAPKEVIKVFKAMLYGDKSKSQIAEENNTSTRTMGRWAEKYDFEGWKVAQTIAPEGIDEQVQEEVDAADAVAPVTPEPEVEDKAPMTLGKGTLADQARQMFTNGAYKRLKEFKKAKKKSWMALGFTVDEVITIDKG